jgi:hypothetical protein
VTQYKTKSTQNSRKIKEAKKSNRQLKFENQKLSKIFTISKKMRKFIKKWEETNVKDYQLLNELREDDNVRLLDS